MSYHVPFSQQEITLVVQEAGIRGLCLSLLRNNENTFNARWLLRRLRNKQHIHCNPMSGLRKHLKKPWCLLCNLCDCKFPNHEPLPLFSDRRVLLSKPKPFTKTKHTPNLRLVLHSARFCCPLAQGLCSSHSTGCLRPPPNNKGRITCELHVKWVPCMPKLFVYRPRWKYVLWHYCVCLWNRKGWKDLKIGLGCANKKTRWIFLSLVIYGQLPVYLQMRC